MRDAEKVKELGWAEESRQRRKTNRELSTTMLINLGFSVDVKNDGQHLIITQGPRVFDFWPGTGLWICRATNSRSRGVHNLIKKVKRVADKQKKKAESDKRK